MSKVIIAGSRTVPEISTELSRKISKILSTLKDVEIVSGGAKGADRFGENYAKNYNIPVKVFKADWDRFGKVAGYKRNVEMAEYATHLIAIVDLSVPSRGTRHMIIEAKSKGLKIRVLYINEDNSKFPKINIGS